MKINGRSLRASTPTEAYLLLSISAGQGSLHIPRRENPFRVARKIEQLARKIDQEIVLLRACSRAHLKPLKPLEPQPSPGADMPFPPEEQDELCA